MLNKNLNYFPEINPTWLLTGKEKMLLQAKINKKAVKEVGLAYINQTLNKQVKTSILFFFSEDEEVRNTLPAYIKKVIIKVKIESLYNGSLKRKQSHLNKNYSY
ncbi:hypothetical protein CXF68_07255 [Tenacibaculum sp. Bg11-29]|uniref:hypothetical protein n=1 Tax=Tenacibaculum sp. Bg11-29 TaxID=2058306 RepID=UPI000C32197D|nr:hypothetical protein [Tenacibaculum sp. Bg11-29]PKH50503.1 hypothetical protein CXF68_07255 [Tenacibaculum sp. Bg11-29]